MKWKYVPATACVVLFATLGYLGLTSNQPPPQDNLYAPNQMNRIPQTLPCPPFCEHALKTFVKGADKDNWLVGRRVYPHWNDVTAIPCPGCHPGGARPCAPFCADQLPSLSEEVHDAWLAGLIQTKGNQMGFTW